MNIVKYLVSRHRLVAERSRFCLQISSKQAAPLCHFHQSSLSRLLPIPTLSYFYAENRSFATQARPRVEAVKQTTTLLDELKADARAYRRIQLDKINQLLVKPEDISNGSYNFLLGCCGQLMSDQPVEKRMKLFKSLWFMAGEPTLDRWKVLLNVYRENKVELEEGLERFVDKVSVEKDREFYELLLGTVCELGQVKDMLAAVDVLNQSGYELNTNAARFLIRGYSKAGDFRSIKTVLDTLSAANIALDEAVYAELLVAQIANDHIEQALKIIKEKGSLLKEIHVAEAIFEAVLKDYKNVVKALVKLLPVDVLNDPAIDPILRNICSDLLRLGRFEAVRSLLEELPVPNFNLNENYDTFGVSLIFEMVEAKAPLQEIVALTDFLIKTERNTRALHVACDCAARSCIELYPPLLDMLRTQEDLRPHYFWPLIVQKFNSHGEAGVLDVLKLMQNFQTDLDMDTISVFVLPKLSVTLKDVRIALKKFEDRGVKMSLLMTPFVSHLLYQNRFDDVNKVVKLYPSKVDTETLIWPLILQATVNKSSEHFHKLSEVIRQLIDKAQNPKHDLAGQLLLELITNKNSKHDSNTLKSLLKQFKKFQIRISKMSANVLKNHFSKSKQADRELEMLTMSLVDDQLTIPTKEVFDTNIAHPRDMSYEELECHLSELEEKKLNARGVLRRLLQLCVREKRLERAVEIKRKCDEAKVELSSGMLASVLELHIKRKNVEEAGKTLEQIKRTFPGFLIDEHKIVDFATLLVENGFLSLAQKTLKQRASSGKIRPGNSNKNIWNLLTSTAQRAAANDSESEKNEAYEMLKFLVDLGYCTFDNTLLGPVIREYLLKNQIKNAVIEFKRIATEKRRTPLQLEIFTTLVRLTNANDPQIPPQQAKALLAEVIQIGSTIHGPVNTNNTLIVALADAGTEAQLRRILINPETRVNHPFILTQCEFLVNSGKLDVVLRLAKCSRGLANVKEADFLAVIMKQYIRDNNCEAAVELFNRLQAEDEEFKITGDFARKLIDLLEVNNYEVPNGVRLYAK